MMTLWCMQASGLNSLVDYLNIKFWYMRGKRDNKEGDSNWARAFPKVWDIRDIVTLQGVEITKVRAWVVLLLSYPRHIEATNGSASEPGRCRGPHNVNEDFVMFLTSKLITFFIDGFTFGIKSQSMAYLLSESAHIYWILDLVSEVHSIWDLLSSGLQKCKDNVFFEDRWGGQQFLVGFKNKSGWGQKNPGGLPLPISNTPHNSPRGAMY